MVAIQHLPPQTRAVLILRDVLTWPAKDVAELLEITPAAVNSALQRAHATMKEHLPERRVDWPAGTDAEAAERELLDAYVAATETQDVAAIKALIRDEVRFSMPPEKGSWVGRDTVVDSWVEGGFGDATGTRFGEFRCTLTRPTASRPSSTTSASPTTTRSASSRSTCCASRTARSPRSRCSTARRSTLRAPATL